MVQQAEVRTYRMKPMMPEVRAKGAAVAAAEYLSTTHPDATGFSPRNLRRMREFYHAYVDTPEVLPKPWPYTYDGNGYLATVSNFKGQVYVQNTYNADGLVIHQYAAEIGTFDFTYDRDGNTTAYTHDAAGNISQITYPDGTVEKMEYNADRKVTKFTDRNGTSSSYTYDGDGQVTSITDGLGNTTVYGYTDGFLTSMTDALGTSPATKTTRWATAPP